MSNSVVFLLIAVGLSVLGTTAVWLHGRPRRGRRENADFGATLRALSSTRHASDPSNGVRPLAPKPPARSPRDPRATRESNTGS
jgi:hypothetical protein